MKKNSSAPIKYGSALKPKQRTTPMALETREVTLNRDQLIQILAQHFDAVTVISEKEDVRDIDFGNMSDKLLKLNLKISKVKEGKLITLANGKKKL
jgi:hypothetical protein